MATPVRPDQLDPATNVTNSAAVVIGEGVSMRKATPRQIVDAGRPIATQDDAEAGTDNEELMTPLRVKQAIDALGVSADSMDQWAEDIVSEAVGKSESVASRTYDTIPEGLDATAIGQEFQVKNGDETVSIYLHDDGDVAVEQRTLATTDYLASEQGASAVGFKYPVSHAVQDTVAAILSERATAKKLGIGTSGDQTDNIRNAFESIEAGVIEFSEPGPIQVSEEIKLTHPIHLIGPGGSFENFGAIKKGTYFRLADNSSLGLNHAMLRVRYEGDYSDSRLAARVSGFAFDGNRGNNTNGHGLVFEGARYAQADNLIFMNCARDGFTARTGGVFGVTQANTRIRDMYSVYNGGNGFVLACPDTTSTNLVAGANGGSGFNISAIRQLLGALAWNNGVDGAYITSETARIMIAAYDNNRSGIFVAGDVTGLNLDGSIVLRNGRDLLEMGYTTDQKSGVYFNGAAKGCSARGLVTGNNARGADAGFQTQTYGLTIASTGAEVDYDTPSSPRDGVIRATRITAGGSGYSTASVSFAGGGGTGATGTVEITDGAVTGITITNGGTGYSGGVTVTITGDGTGATAIANTGANLFGPVKDSSLSSGTRAKKLMIDDGTPLGRPYSVTFSRFFNTLAEGESDTTTYNSSALGLQTTHNDFVIMAHLGAASPAGVQVTATLTSNNTISITRTNHSGASLASVTSDVRLAVLRFS